MTADAAAAGLYDEVPDYSEALADGRAKNGGFGAPASVARYSAFLDACVLVPIALADTLLRLAEVGLYRPLWSDRVLDEMVDAIGMIDPELASGPARSRADAMQAPLRGRLCHGLGGVGRRHLAPGP